MTTESAPRRDRRRTLLLIGGVVLLCAVVAIVAFLVGRGQGEPPVATPTPSATASPSPTTTWTSSATPTPTATADPGPVPPTDAQREHFAEALQSGNTAVFEQDFADPVDVIYVATECCGPISRTEAIQALDYVNPGSGATWDFHLDEATLASYRAGIYGEFFPVDAIVGQSSDGATVSFVPGADGLIARILLSYVTPV